MTQQQKFSVGDILTRLLEIQISLSGLGQLMQRAKEPDDGLCSECDIGVGLMLINLSKEVHQVREILDRSAFDEGFKLQ